MDEIRVSFEPPKTPFEQLEILMREFGGDWENIPEERLKAIGYWRQPIEGGWKLARIPDEVSLAKAAQDEAERKKDWQDQWEKKTSNTPFGRIEVQATETSIAYRHLDIQAVNDLRFMIDELATFVVPSGISTLEFLNLGLPETANIIVLHRNFLAFAAKLDKNVGIEVDELADHIFMCWSFALLQEGGPFKSSFLESDPRQFLMDYTMDYVGDGKAHKIIPSKNAGRLAMDFERLAGALTDVSYYKHKYLEVGKELFEADLNESFEEDCPQLTAYIRKNELWTQHQIMSHFIGKYLEEIGLRELGQLIPQSSSAQEATILISKADFIGKLVAEEKQIKALVKGGTREQYSQYSGRLKEISQEKKHMRQIQSGLYALLNLPETVANVLKTRMKIIQDFLTTKNTQNGDSDSALILDATPNEELDSNPGAVSGDCTEGAPLPFNRPDLPLYNVKVYNPDNLHIGNMYLLVTKALNGKLVWHFDAVQIPSRSVDWSITIPKLIERISLEAERQGVDVITMNDWAVNTSNYDYIQDALSGYWKSHGEKYISIKKPKKPKVGRYSDLQGTNEVKVLWERNSEPSTHH